MASEVFSLSESIDLGGQLYSLERKDTEILRNTSLLSSQVHAMAIGITNSDDRAQHAVREF